MENQRDIDVVLVERFQAGEDIAFDLLAAKYRCRLFRVVLRIVDERAAAEDVVQEAFIRAFRTLPTFRKESAFYTWIFKIFINAAKNARNRQALRRDVWVQLNQEHEEKTDDRFVTVDDDSPLAILENKQTVRALHEALTALPDMMARPLLLCELEEMRYPQISEILRCPVGTVRSRIARARELVALRVGPMLEPHSAKAIWTLR